MDWWLSCQRFTVRVRVHDGLVVWAAPIVRRFVGQPFGNLERWAAGFGGLRVERLP